MSGTRAVVVAFAIAGAVLAFGPGAHAFNRETADGSGAPLHWQPQDLPVTYTLNRPCAGSGVDAAECEAAVERSFGAWTVPTCTVLRFDYLGLTDRTDVGYQQANPADNINLVIWHMQGWPYDASALALTTNTYDSSNGVIVDSDLEVNGQDFTWRVLTAVDPHYVDIQNTVTHEVGHVIGLDHTSDPSSTMYPTAPNGEISKRILAADDVNGVCSIYPVAGYDGGAGDAGGSGGGAAAGGTGGKDGVSEGNGTFAKGCGCTTLEVGY